MFARNRLRDLIVLIFAHAMQIQVAHALCKQGCRLISYTADIRLVTIATCYNCPRSPLLYLLHNINTVRIFFCEITNDNQKDQHLVNYNKSYIGVNVIIGNLAQKSEITTSE